jgi:hypothetical protein
LFQALPQESWQKPDELDQYSETAHLEDLFNSFNIVSELSQTDSERLSKAFFTGSISAA